MKDKDAGLLGSTASGNAQGQSPIAATSTLVWKVVAYDPQRPYGLGSAPETKEQAEVIASQWKREGWPCVTVMGPLVLTPSESFPRQIVRTERVASGQGGAAVAYPTPSEEGTGDTRTPGSLFRPAEETAGTSDPGHAPSVRTPEDELFVAWNRENDLRRDAEELLAQVAAALKDRSLSHGAARVAALTYLDGLAEITDADIAWAKSELSLMVEVRPGLWAAKESSSVFADRGSRGDFACRKCGRDRAVCGHVGVFVTIENRDDL